MSSKCWKFRKGCSVSPSGGDNERGRARKGHAGEYEHEEQSKSCENRMGFPPGLRGALCFAAPVAGCTGSVLFCLVDTSKVKDFNFLSRFSRGFSVPGVAGALSRRSSWVIELCAMGSGEHRVAEVE